jgi:hypothetical protein
MRHERYPFPETSFLDILGELARLHPRATTTAPQPVDHAAVDHILPFLHTYAKV